MPDGTNIHHCGVRRWVNQDVEVTVIGIVTVEDGTKHTSIAGTMSLNDATNGGAMGIEGVGWLHGIINRFIQTSNDRIVEGLPREFNR